MPSLFVEATFPQNSQIKLMPYSEKHAGKIIHSINSNGEIYH